MKTAGRVLALAVLLVASARCSHTRDLVPDGGTSDVFVTETDPHAWIDCLPGQARCIDNLYQQCSADGEMTAVQTTDCTALGDVCVVDHGGCAPCMPGSTRCADDYSGVLTCRADASGWDVSMPCDTTNGIVCRGGDHCAPLCDSSQIVGTNIGCEYYAADLDNAQLGPGNDAYSQQYAVVVSNPDPIFTARVRIEWNTAPQGQPPVPAMVASALIPPMDLEVFPLPERQVDCPAMVSDYDTGAGSCLSSQAYHIVSTAPVIAYQFNPLTNDVHVFSNDASLLVPTNSLGSDYLVMGWPQTLASSPANVVLNPGSPTDLRGFVTVIGTQAGTHVHVRPAADVLAGNVLPSRGLAGTGFDVTLGPFDVLNLETDGFEADLTGSTITSDQPVVVFSGSECSDVPQWFDLNDRKCCCDHLEAQQFARNTYGTQYFAIHTPYRTPAVHAAGAPVAILQNEPEYFRVLAMGSSVTHVRTSVPSTLDDPSTPPYEFDLMPGQFQTIKAYRHFQIDANGPVSVANFMSSQGNTGIPLSYPGGDPSFIPIPPEEQWRSSYVFLTPDSYAFDFVSVVAPVTAHVQLDQMALPTMDCTTDRADGCVDTLTTHCDPPTFVVYGCQLSYPIISPDLPYPNNVMPGEQHDGVHVVSADMPVGVIVSGFDLRVSYGYPAGTQLQQLF